MTFTLSCAITVETKWGQSVRPGHNSQLALTRLLQDGEYGSTKSTAAEIASGFPLIVTAAERRAHAVYYSFTLLCIGLLVLLVVVLIESHRWRSTITTESEVSFATPRLGVHNS